MISGRSLVENTYDSVAIVTIPAVISVGVDVRSYKGIPGDGTRASSAAAR